MRAIRQSEQRSALKISTFVSIVHILCFCYTQSAHVVIQVFLQMVKRTHLPINMATLLNSSATLATHYKGQPFGHVKTTVCGLVSSLPVKVSRRRYPNCRCFLLRKQHKSGVCYCGLTLVKSLVSLQSIGHCFSFSFIHSFVRSFVCLFRSFVHSFVRPSVRLFVRPSVRPSVSSFRSFVRSFVRSCMHACMHLCFFFLLPLFYLVVIPRERAKTC